MKSFLEYVAQDIYDKFGNDMSRVCIVFPNKRASLFMNKYLSEISDQPLWAPHYTTISDLFKHHSSLIVEDQIKLVCLLYRSYMKCTGLNETLDHFYGWGQLLLSDFDDIDKNMADALHVFANVKNLHEYDDVSYLTEEQKDMLKTFFTNFTDSHNTELKKRFLAMWSHLLDIYNDFRSRLYSEGIAYEGMLYRDVIENNATAFTYNKYLFVGFNFLHKVEQDLFLLLKKQGMAAFYWDFDNYYMPKSASEANVNEAGRFIARYLEMFPNELDIDNDDIYGIFERPKDISFISTGTNDVQARYVSKWLKENNRYAGGNRTAIVLCDENMLQTVVYCIPQEVENVNVTTGYPLSQSPFASLLDRLLMLQSNGCINGADKYRVKYVNAILTHPYANMISEKCSEVYNKLKSNCIFFPTIKDIADGDRQLVNLFRPRESNNELLGWMIDVLDVISSDAKDKDPFFQESLFCSYTLLNRLKNLVEQGYLNVDIITLHRLLTQLVKSTSIPFHGEPAIGIQIMGVLETRNLDFDHILMLSCNEGNMPKGVNDSSFIPYSIRKAYGLTTVDHKVAIYSYYFHRLLQRARDITVLYNSSTDFGHTGEMSRFMLQLLVESGHAIKRMVITMPNSMMKRTRRQIEKDDRMLERLKMMKSLSPTAINRYMRCPVQFYYNHIAGIRELDENDGELDNRTFGNIFHKASEYIYNQLSNGGSKTIIPSSIDAVLRSKRFIADITDHAFGEELFKVSNDKYVPQYNGLQIINREVIIHYLRILLELDKKMAPFNIFGTEKEVYESFDINANGETFTVKIGGWVDRIDIVTNPQNGQRTIRVIDYKTGSGKFKNDLMDLDEMFSGNKIRSSHSDYYLQAFLYSSILRNSDEYNPQQLPVSPALLFIQHTAEDNYSPVLELGKKKVYDIQDYDEAFRERLQQKVEEIYTMDKPFVPTADRQICATCPYSGFCGKVE